MTLAALSAALAIWKIAGQTWQINLHAKQVRLGLSVSAKWDHPAVHSVCSTNVCLCVCVHNYSRCLYNWPLRCQLQRQLPELNYGHWLRLPLCCACCSHSMTGCTVCSPGSWQCDLLDGGGALLCSGMPISAINNNGHKWKRKREREREIEGETLCRQWLLEI